MKIKIRTRIILSLLLSAVGLIIMINLLRTFGGTSFRSPLSVLSTLGSIALLVFILISLYALVKKKIIAKETFVISMVLSAVAILLAVLFCLGFVQDLLNVHCLGLMGGSGSCTLSPTLILTLLVLQPTPLAMMGLVSIFGTYTQLNAQRANTEHGTR